jgi:ABC-type nickel/cobalt efflux system permease component RcnA
LQTFFSTIFFSFNDDLGGRVYSQWIWLYFLVTIALTLIVVVGTWFLWRKKEQEVMAALITPKEEQGTDPVGLNQRPTELELDQFVEQESGNVARRATIARLRTGLDWTQSITQQKTAHGQGKPSA